MQGMILAEMSLPAEYYPDVVPGDTDRSDLLKHEERALYYGIDMFDSHTDMLSVGHTHRTCMLDFGSGVDIDVFAFQHCALNDLTNMSLGRELQSQDHLNRDAMERSWLLEQCALFHDLLNFDL